jgi:transposase
MIGRVNRLKNNIRSLFANRGLPLPRGQKAWSREGSSQIAEHSRPFLKCSEDELWRGELDLELLQLKHLCGQQAEIEKKLLALAKENQQVQLLCTIPGVGRRTAEVVVAYLDDPERFQNARQVSSYAGLVPRRFQSGEMDRHGRIHKRGPGLLRTALVEAAWMTLRYNPWARSVYERICGRQRTRRKKAIVAVARKLLVRCWIMLLRREPWKEDTAAKDVVAAA